MRTRGFWISLLASFYINVLLLLIHYRFYTNFKTRIQVHECFRCPEYNIRCSQDAQNQSLPSRSPQVPYDVVDPCNLQHLLSSSFTSEHLHLFQQHCDLVWYNRVMKCGSTTLFQVLVSLDAPLEKCPDLKLRWNHYISPEKWEEEAIRFVNTTDRPCIRIGHHYFIPFKKVHIPQPFIINLVRHPIPRTISQYFFKSFGMGKDAERIVARRNTSRFQGTLRDCATGVDPLFGCNNFFGYFCEDQTTCMPRGVDALALAMRNIEEYGMIIGLTEELDSFLQVLELLAPRFFGNIRKLYNQTYEVGQRLSSNKALQDMFDLKTSEVKDLPYILDNEIELYDFMKKRFYKIKQKVFELTGNTHDT